MFLLTCQFISGRRWIILLKKATKAYLKKQLVFKVISSYFSCFSQPYLDIFFRLSTGVFSAVGGLLQYSPLCQGKSLILNFPYQYFPTIVYYSPQTSFYYHLESEDWFISFFTI